MYNKYFLIALGLLFCQVGHSQQFGLFNQQYQNLFLVNPAYTGQGGQPVANLHYRSQWSNFEGSPNTFAATFQMPIKGKKYAVGGKMLREELSALARTNLQGSYAYEASFNEKSGITFGISAGLLFSNLDFDKLNPDDLNDSVLGRVDGNVEGDANFGALFRYENFQFGLSTYYFFADTRGEPENGFGNRIFSHTTLISSYEYEIPDTKLMLKPLVLYRFATQSPGQFDLTLIGEWNKQFWVLAGHRTHFGFLAGAGMHINDQFSLGYGYEHSNQGIGAFANHNHEIMLAYRFGKKQNEELPQEEVVEMPLSEPTNNIETTDEEIEVTRKPLISAEEYQKFDVPEADYRATFEGQGFILNGINYAGNSSEIPVDGIPELNKVAAFLKRYPKIVMEIGAYTSNQGDANMNLLVSKSRSEKIVDYLTTKGVPKEQLKAVGYGPRNLRFKSDSNEEELNKRIEIKIIKGVD